jgi:NAD(P)-dependent dehydrogenase (short-subunit alcohol dehydrogenase family)
MSKNFTIVVTGSNRGIGQGIIQLLAKTPPL